MMNFNQEIQEEPSHQMTTGYEAMQSSIAFSYTHSFVECLQLLSFREVKEFMCAYIGVPTGMGARGNPPLAFKIWVLGAF